MKSRTGIETGKQRKILFICGTMNTTTMLHQISKELTEYESYFTHMYADGLLKFLAEKDMLNFVPLSGKIKQDTINYFKEKSLNIDFYGKTNTYDLIVTCTDLIIPQNIKNTKIVHVQEGMTDPEDLRYLLVKYLKLPLYLASTSVMGLSDSYDYFCVASNGYRDLFTKKGVNPDKIVVTGIPNFDNFKNFENNSFPYKNFVLVATSDTRETFKPENRKKFIENALKIANGRKIIFKLHPNEKFVRAKREIEKYAPGSIVYTKGDIREMIANCDVLITKYSSVVYCGLALNKEVYSDVPVEELRKLTPIQNDCTSSKQIANVCRLLLDTHISGNRSKSLKFQPLKLLKEAAEQNKKNRIKNRAL